ncbi:hypothetical protein CR970_00730 [Candidatus Saccharibacteria bacterium]|nr:MAG: hypothetical protein CR970_00730 [Candidatus Saccharibacteria bacterium]
MALEISDEQFEQLIAQAMDELPQEYIKGLDNVLVTFADQPSAEQRSQLQLRCNQTLFGLYEGVPRTRRAANYQLVLPDRITLFKLPICEHVETIRQLQREVKHTLWHEIAHYYGLDHDRIHALERGEA